MNPATRSRPTPLALRWLLAPAHLLERTRGRKRLGLMMLYGLIAAVAGLFAWRAASLNGLPDVGDPFDVDAFGNVTIPEGENAITLYEQAAAKLVPLKGAGDVRFTPDWSAADPAYLRWAESNGEALDLWLRGSRRERALHVRPKDLRFATRLTAAEALRDLAHLGLLEASRREQAGDVAGAWEMYRALLRSSRHVGLYGCAIQRLIGSAILRQSLGPIQRWANDPRVDVALLRRAMRDVRDCEAMTPPPSEMVKVEYMSFMSELDDPSQVASAEMAIKDGTIWYHHLPRAPEFKRWLKRDPERSRRVARLIFANWLAYFDRPPSQRVMVRFESSTRYFRVGPDAPAPARALDPEAIDRWLLTTEFALCCLPSLFDWALGVADADPRQHRSLRVTLAEECYAREHGGPPKRLGELVGPYLDALPEGYEPGDVPAAPDAKEKR